MESLKERTLGVEVFERDPHYDTNQDPVVRSTAGEVRKRLAQYYLETAHEHEIRISMPPGSYVPEIRPLPEKAEYVVPRRPSNLRKWLWVAAAAAVVIMAGTSAILLTPAFRRTDLDRFWAPIVDAQGAVMVCMGQPRVFKFNPQTQRELIEWIQSGNENPPARLAFVPLGGILPVWDQYIDLHDSQALIPVVSLLAQRGKKVVVSGGRALSLADLRGKPSVLIGAFNNEWTMSLTSQLRFYFDFNPETGAMSVRDRQNPAKSDWVITEGWPPPGNLPNDYAIVSRLLHPTTEQTVVSAAGLAWYGTRAAGEFLTNPSYFAQALHDAPRDWYRKNMQVVLSVKVLSRTQGPPKVLAVHFW